LLFHSALLFPPIARFVFIIFEFNISSILYAQLAQMEMNEYNNTKIVAFYRKRYTICNSITPCLLSVISVGNGPLFWCYYSYLLIESIVASVADTIVFSPTRTYGQAIRTPGYWKQVPSQLFQPAVYIHRCVSHCVRA
jgi:hypothetical protein